MLTKLVPYAGWALIVLGALSGGLRAAGQTQIADVIDSLAGHVTSLLETSAVVAGGALLHLTNSPLQKKVQ